MQKTILYYKPLEGRYLDGLSSYQRLPWTVTRAIATGTYQIARKQGPERWSTPPSSSMYCFDHHQHLIKLGNPGSNPGAGVTILHHATFRFP